MRTLFLLVIVAGLVPLHEPDVTSPAGSTATGPVSGATAGGASIPHEAAALGPIARQDSAASATLSGVTMPRTRQVAGRGLVLNGMALRKKSLFKVYVAGLYLPARSSDAAAILGADEPRLLVMEFVRGVDRKKMCEAWYEALEANTPRASARLQQQFATLCTWMEDVEKGEQFVFAYVPGGGTSVEVRGSAKGTLPGKEFADALFKAWIGPKPGPGEEFKRDLLGG